VLFLQQFGKKLCLRGGANFATAGTRIPPRFQGSDGLNPNGRAGKWGRAVAAAHDNPSVLEAAIARVEFWRRFR
jgi:hypothetical protein